MKTNIIKYIAIAASIVISSPLAIAENCEDGECNKGKGNTSEKTVKNPDRLSPEEKEARRAKILEEFDANGDGELSKEERKAARQARRAKLREKFDKDGDGQLSQEERREMREAMRKHRKKHGKKGKRRNKPEDAPTSDPTTEPAPEI